MQNTQANNQQRNYCDNNLKDVLYQAKQSIPVNKKLHPAGTLVKIFQKAAEGANPYVRFGYVPQTVFNHTRGEVLG